MAADIRKQLDKMVDLCMNDLSKEVQTDKVNVSFVTANKTTWQDAAMGVPEFGMVYPEIPVEGFRIVLRCKDINYQYHTDLDNRYKLFRKLG